MTRDPADDFDHPRRPPRDIRCAGMCSTGCGRPANERRHLSGAARRDRVEPRAPLSGLGRLAADRARRRAGRGDRPAVWRDCPRRRTAAICRQPDRPRPPHRRADPAALGRAAPIAFDDRLREISIGSWDGLDRDEIARSRPGIFDGDGRYEWYFRTPDGETYDDVRRPDRRLARRARATAPRSSSRTASSPGCCAGSMPVCRAPRRCACRCRRTASTASPTGGSRRSLV